MAGQFLWPGPMPPEAWVSEYESWRLVAEEVDGRILSTQVAGGFVGTYIGMYASSNGQTSKTVADWDRFEYSGTEKILR